MTTPEHEDIYSVAFANAAGDIAQLKSDVTELLSSHPDLSLNDPFSPQARLNHKLGMIAGIESVQVSLAPGVDPAIVRKTRQFVDES